jgi:hypothetical protein
MLILACLLKNIKDFLQLNRLEIMSHEAKATSSNSLIYGHVYIYICSHYRFYWLVFHISSSFMDF